MIEPNAKLTIQRLPLSCIQIKEVQSRNMAQLMIYMDKMRAQPEWTPGLLFVTPSDTHPGMYCLLDGHHRALAMFMLGRADALCVVVEAPEPVDDSSMTNPSAERDEHVR